jgi:hypothetical protein
MTILAATFRQLALWCQELRWRGAILPPHYYQAHVSPLPIFCHPLSERQPLRWRRSRKHTDSRADSGASPDEEDPMSSVVDAFGTHLHGVRQTLAVMNEDERLTAVLTMTDELIEFYMTIAALNEVFHERCRNGTLPVDRPIAGHA